MRLPGRKASDPATSMDTAQQHRATTQDSDWVAEPTGGNAEDVVKVAGEAASKLASSKQAGEKAPHQLVNDVTDAVAVEAAKQGVPAKKAAQLAAAVVKDAGADDAHAKKAVALATAKMALAEGKSAEQALAEAAKAVMLRHCLVGLRQATERLRALHLPRRRRCCPRRRQCCPLPPAHHPRHA